MLGKITERKIFILLISCISVFAISSFFISPFFKVKQIEVSQLKYLDNQDIKDKVNYVINKNIWLISKFEMNNILLQNNYIKDIRIVKKYPDTIFIQVEERTPVAKINNNGKFLVFNDHGYILEEGAIKTKVKVPLVKGVGYSFNNGKIIFPPLFTEIVQALPLIASERRQMLKTINYNSNKDITINLSSNIDVFIGESKQIQEKFNVLDSILKKIAEGKFEVDYIDLKVIQKPVVKMKK